MINITIADKIYQTYIALENSLLILKERTQKIESVTNHEELIRECDCLYEAYNYIDYVLQKLLNMSKDDYANKMPTKSVS